jgi:DNA-binding GntR family transcriptional regulator
MAGRKPYCRNFHKLEREGLIERQPRGGFTVLGLDRDDIEETFGIRSVLEGYAARLAAVKHDAQELEQLENKINEFQNALNRKKMNLLPAINTEFHDLLYSLSKSPKLINIINGLRDQIYRYRQMILKERKFASTSNLDHKKMLQPGPQKDVAIHSQTGCGRCGAPGAGSHLERAGNGFKGI